MLDPPGFKYDLFLVLPGFTAHRPNDLPQEVDPHFPGEIMLSIMFFRQNHLEYTYGPNGIHGIVTPIAQVIYIMINQLKGQGP